MAKGGAFFEHKKGTKLIICFEEQALIFESIEKSMHLKMELPDQLEVEESYQTDIKASNQPKYLRYRWWCFIGVRIFSCSYKAIPSIGEMSHTYL